MKKRFLNLLILCLVISLILPTAVNAASISHLETTDSMLTVPGRSIYEPVKAITAATIGLDPEGDSDWSGLTDLCCDKQGRLYVLCGENSKLFYVDPKRGTGSEITVTMEDGSPATYTGAMGIYVSKSDEVFILDTSNARILVLDKEYKVRHTISLPESDLIPEGFPFSPVAMAEDNDGNYYVLSQGSYYGAMVFSQDFIFNSFFGANTVTYSALDTLEYLWDLLTNTDEKQAKKERLLPSAFVDLASDKDGFIYTCTGMLSAYNIQNGTGQITMLSPGGTNILLRRSAKDSALSSRDFNFLEGRLSTKSSAVMRLQNLVAININDDGYILALDQITGTVYMYDLDCNLMGTFGGGVGEGGELGTFKNPVAMAVYEDQVYIADYKKNSITVFDETEYCKLLMQAQDMHRQGNYLEAKPLWEQIHKLDQNNQFAYRGLAKASYREGDYSAAMKYAEMVYDYDTYDLAYSKVMTGFTQKNFTWLFLLGIALVIGVIVALRKLKYREEPMIRNVKVHAMFGILSHPFDGFANIKFKKLGSAVLATILVLLFFLSSNIKTAHSSFLFRAADVNTYNVLFTLATTVGLVILWTVSNWLVTTLMGGLGTMKEVYITTAYCLIPYIIYNLLFFVLSFFLSYDLSVFMNGLSAVAVIYTGFLLFVALAKTHEYSFGKVLATTVVTVLLMILIVFIIFMIVILLQQLGNFFYTIFMEVAYR